jgi:hypothetical protein
MRDTCFFASSLLTAMKNGSPFSFCFVIIKLYRSERWEIQVSIQGRAYD